MTGSRLLLLPRLLQGKLRKTVRQKKLSPKELATLFHPSTDAPADTTPKMYLTVGKSPNIKFRFSGWPLNEEFADLLRSARSQAIG